jgi:hypothetical protein
MAAARDAADPALAIEWEQPLANGDDACRFQFRKRDPA